MQKANRQYITLVARRAHNPKVVGSSPASATTRDPKTKCLRVLFFSEFQVSMKQPVISKSRWMFEVRYSVVFGE